MQIQIIQ